MGQKKIWMNYLIIGLTISLSSILPMGCGITTVEVAYKAELEYLNSSDSTILFRSINNSRSSLFIGSGSRKTISIVGHGGGDEPIKIIGKGVINYVHGDQVFIQYGKNHCITFMKNRSHDINNYKCSVVDESTNHYKFIYEFTNRDFDEIGLCH